MQLARGLKPISLGVCVLASQITYADIDSFTKNNIISVNANKGNNDQNRYDYYDLVVRSQFDVKLKQWKKETMLFSSVDDIIENENFQWIISQKEKVVPYIIEEIDMEPSNLVWALNFIYKRNISPRQLTITEACKLWVRMYRK